MQARRKRNQHSVGPIVVHDFSGHPFQAQFARQLARRGESVIHVYCTSFQTPQGNVGISEGTRFRSIGVALRRPFAKYSFGRRLLQEIEYGVRVSRTTMALRPRAVISANTPLLAAAVFHLVLKLRRVPVVFWQQDVYSVAMATHLEQRLGPVGRVVGSMLVLLEQVLTRTSAAVVVISDDFVEMLTSWGVPRVRVAVIENWAPLDELPVGSRPNAWSSAHHVADDATVLLYAGTLGLKHQPAVLLDLARTVAADLRVRLIVASEGIGADWLAENAVASDRIELIPFQPYEQLSDMLATADVLLVLLEPDAGSFSVPSKVLTYHCAGRAILGAMPADNLASRIIAANDSGVVVAPGDAEGFVAAARRLIDDPEGRRRMGENARAYAEHTFDIERITDDFAAVLSRIGAMGDSASAVDTGPQC